MAVTLTGAAGLFTNLGKVFHALNTLNTARGTTVPTEVLDILEQAENLSNTLDLRELVESIASSIQTWQAANTFADPLVQYCKDLIVQMVDDDNPQEDDSVETAMDELITQMEGAGGETNPDDDVDASACTVSVAANAGNNTDGVIVASATRGDGRNCETAFAEDVEVVVSSTDGLGSVELSGEADEPDPLSHNWPKGSGVTVALGGIDAASSLLANGGMDDEDDRTNTPDDWIVETGTIGTTIKMTDYEKQDIVISGGPSSGTYTLKYTDVDSDEQFTRPLAYNASGATVQAELRKLLGLENVTVSTTGATPNFTHVVTFEEMFPPGNIGLMTATDTFDVGSVAVNANTNGSAHVYKDKAVEFDSDGAQLTAIKQRITGLSGRTSYAVNAFMKVDAFPAAGVITVDLIDGAGSVINDVQGTANSFTIDPKSGGDLSTTAFTAVNGFFRLPTIVPDLVYLRIRISTAISSTASLFIDEVAFVEATELYVGGPLVSFFAGTTPLGSRDKWTITVTQDRAGEFQEWFYRADILDGSKLLPSDSAGTETVADTLIA